MDLIKLNRIQKSIGKRVTITQVNQVQQVVGLDVCYLQNSNQAVGAAVVLNFPQLNCIEQKTLVGRVRFPYLPGYFAFREVPILLRLLKRIKTDYQLIFCDGHGWAHPRRCGLATHLGVLSQKPTIGVAKNSYFGSGQLTNLQRGAINYLKDQDQIIGAIVCTQDGVKPLFVSIGNLITLEQAIQFTLNCTPHFRIPKPLRLAHQLAKKVAQTL